MPHVNGLWQGLPGCCVHFSDHLVNLNMRIIRSCIDMLANGSHIHLQQT